jgi:hypothetical protein
LLENNVESSANKAYVVLSRETSSKDDETYLLLQQATPNETAARLSSQTKITQSKIKYHRVSWGEGVLRELQGLYSS